MEMPIPRPLLNLLPGEGAGIVRIAGAIEQELSGLPPEERQEYLLELGMKEPGLNRLIKAGYELLGLLTFFTVGEKKPKPGPYARAQRHLVPLAKFIRTERGFIRAEVIAYKDYLECRAESIARDKGLMRSEGKEYVVRDGDCILFRFNV